MKDAAEFGRLEDAMLYRVLPRVRQTDLKRDSSPPAASRDDSPRDPGPRRTKNGFLITPQPEPALPCFALSDSVPSIRIPARPPTPKFHVVCNNYEDVSDHVLEYVSEPRVPVNADGAREEERRPSAAPLHTSLREGVRPSRGIASSTAFFLAIIAAFVIAVSIVALAVLLPGSDWALIQG